ncbi:unnamed protein product [Vicia faba]|uniref:phosphatidate cytidylyltransferase n=1 Tax=Vicia faba TaxID=3906 RepID=A0AAV0ZJX4_VICFA|nr:unnamed protein product [Vicia faba]
MAKSKNHTAHNQYYKAHKNGIKKPNRHHHTSTKGMDPKFLRNQRYARKHNKKLWEVSDAGGITVGKRNSIVTEGKFSGIENNEVSNGDDVKIKQRMRMKLTKVNPSSILVTAVEYGDTGRRFLFHPLHPSPKPFLWFTRQPLHPRFIVSSAHQPEPDRLPPLNAQKGSQLKNRVVFGLGIGISAGAIILAGGWVFAAAMAAAVFAGSREYFELIRSQGITEGMTPPPLYVSRVCSVICALMPLYVMYRGHIDVSVTSSSFVLAMALLVQRGNARFA